MKPDKPITNKPPQSQTVVKRARKLPEDFAVMKQLIEDNGYTCNYQISQYFGCTNQTVLNYQHHEQLRQELEKQRAIMVQRAELMLFEKLSTPRAGAAEYALFVKLYGDQKSRDRIKNTTVIEQADTNIVPLEDLE